MAFANMKESNFTPAPPGSHGARVNWFLDLGSHTGQFGIKRQIYVSWELPDCLMDNDQPFTVSSFYNASLSRKSNLRKDIESVLSRTLTPEEIEKFDPREFAETPCLLSLKHTTTQNGDTRADIQSAGALPKGMPVSERVNELLIFDLNNPDTDILQKLPEFFQKKIQSSPEWVSYQNKDFNENEDVPVHEPNDSLDGI